MTWPSSQLNVLAMIRSRALSECDLQEVRSLKAFIAYDAIVHPDHPLSTGKGGVELYLGTSRPPSLVCHTTDQVF